MAKNALTCSKIVKVGIKWNIMIQKGGLSLEHPQGVGIVGMVGTVGTVGTVGIVGIEFCHPEPRPTTPSVLVDISSYSYLKEQKLSYK